MSIAYTLTDAAREALINADNNGVNALNITKLAIGTGHRAPAATDTALVTQHSTAAATGGANADNDEIVVSALFTGAAAVAITEIGIMAQVGSNAEFLFAYASTADGDTLAQKTADLNLRLTSAIAFAGAIPASLRQR